MRELEAFRTFVAPLVLACPDTFIDQHLITAARELCQRTRVWRAVDEFAATGDASEIIFVPPDASLFEIESVHFDGRPLRHVHFDAGKFTAEADGAPPVAVMQIRPDTLSVIPPQAGTVRISMFLMPSNLAEALPEILYDHFAQDIAHGALASLMVMPNVGWSSPEVAAYYRSMFVRTLDRNFGFHARGQHRAPVRTTPRFV
ncbi:hypothetical protein ACRC7T_18105 [Segnochrobactraceae bacterium EtOH-i3]